MKKTHKKIAAAMAKNRHDAIVNILTGQGVPGRDKKEANIFVPERRFSDVQLDIMYRHDGITRNIVDVVANEMTRQGWEIEGEFGSEVIAKMEDLRAFESIGLLIKWARLYGGAICVMGIDDGFIDPENYLEHLQDPVDERTIRGINWLHVFDRFQVQVLGNQYESYLGSPNYGKPIIYTITDNRTNVQFNVHHSRVLRMDWGMLSSRRQLENQGWGDSVIQHLYRDIRNYSATVGSMATIMENFVHTILGVPGLSELTASDCSSEMTLKRLDQFAQCISNVNMGVLDAEEQYSKHSTSVAGVPEMLDRFMQALSAASRIPVSLLFGRSAAGLNATGEHDLRNFYDSVKREQESKLRPCLEKLIRYIYKSKEGPSRGLEPDNWSLQFNPLWQLGDDEEAALRKTVAETDAIYIANGVLSSSEVAESRFGSGRWCMETQLDTDGREEESGLIDIEEEALEAYKARLAQ